MQIAKKISIGGLNGIRGGFACNWTEGKPETQAAFFAARIVGIAAGCEVKNTTYGESLKFTGEFRGTNQEGEIVAAPVAYLPSPADSLLRDALAAAGKQVEFAFDIYVQPTPKKQVGDRGYEYVIKPLQESRASDPLENMMAALPAPAVKPKQPQLPGTEAATGEGAPASPTPAPTAAPAPSEAPAENGKKNHGKK